MSMSRNSTQDSFRSPYPGYDVLDKWDSVSWDDVTRGVVGKRLAQVPERRFFSEDEWHLLHAICERIIPQPDRPVDPVPIVPWIDDKLHQNRGDGYRYEDMPPMREAWHLGLDGIEREAQRRHGARFTALPADEQDALLSAVQHGEVAGGPWDRLPPKRFFKDTLLNTVVGVYYAHPAAWSESGFGGPASPRGYVRLDADLRDAWEAEARHER
jgi:hypothetical protein